MRTDILRVYKSVHTWTGLIAGMALFIAFYAGALTVFKAPLARWAAPPTAVQAVPLSEAPDLIRRTLQAAPEAGRSFLLHLKPNEAAPARLSWQIHNAGADEHDTRLDRHYVAWMQADGALRVEQSQPSRLAECIDVLHRVVGLPIDTDASRWVMGLVAALYAVALVSGVIVLLPTLVKDLFALRLGRNLKRMWLDAHNVVGIVSLPFHLVMALTATVFAFHDGIYALQDKMFHGGRLAAAFGQRPGATVPVAPRDPAAMLAPAVLVAQAKALSPTFEPQALQYQQVTGPRAVVRIWGHDDTAISPRAMGGFVALDPYSGRVTTVDYLPGRQGAATATLSSFFALHFATYGGTPVRWMYFLLALAGAWLFYSGNLLWIESRRKAQRRGGDVPQQRRSAYAMAAATAGVCLGCVCGVSLAIVASRWLHGRVADPGSLPLRIYYMVFLASVGWAFLRGGARASGHLLWFAASATLAIPLTSLLAWLFPGAGLAAHWSAEALGVDLTALAGAACFARMARAAAWRAKHGPADSVWSARRAPEDAEAPL